jgi:hypothetical protein
VYEIAFRTGDSPTQNTRADLRYMRELLGMIEREGIPAPAPIEQRWSAGGAVTPGCQIGYWLSSIGCVLTAK